MHLLLHANYEDKKWRGTWVKRGQIITSREKLANEVGISVQQLRTAIEKLKSTSEITCVSTNGFTRFCIQNFNKYQDGNQEDNQGINKRVTSDQPADNQRITTTKEGKERKKEEEDIHTKKNIKKKFLDFVYLHESEYQKLVDEYGEAFTERCIKKLDLTIPNRKEGPYKDCYRAILNWVVEAVQKADSSKKKTEKISLRYGKEVKETGLMNDFLDAQKYLKED